MYKTGALPTQVSAMASNFVVLRSAKASLVFPRGHESLKPKVRKGLTGTIGFDVHCVLHVFLVTLGSPLPQLVSWALLRWMSSPTAPTVHSVVFGLFINHELIRVIREMTAKAVDVLGQNIMCNSTAVQRRQISYKFASESYMCA